MNAADRAWSRIGFDRNGCGLLKYAQSPGMAASIRRCRGRSTLRRRCAGSDWLPCLPGSGTLGSHAVRFRDRGRRRQAGWASTRVAILSRRSGCEPSLRRRTFRGLASSRLGRRRRRGSAHRHRRGLLRPPCLAAGARFSPTCVSCRSAGPCAPADMGRGLVGPGLSYSADSKSFR